MTPAPKHILILNGPPGVGKTSVSERLRALDPATVCIHGDALRAFAPQDARTFLGPRSTYQAAATLATAYLEMGARRVIFEYVFENPPQVETFRSAVRSGLPIHLFTLWAPLDVVQLRERQRSGRAPLGQGVEASYRALEANLDRLGVIVPTADRAPEQVAKWIHENVNGFEGS